MNTCNIPGTERRLIKKGEELSLWNLLLKKYIRISIRVKKEMMRKIHPSACLLRITEYASVEGGYTIDRG